MLKLVRRIIKFGIFAGFVMSVVASVKATIAANEQTPRDGAPDA